MQTGVSLPQPDVSAIDLETGRFIVAWWYYFQKLFARTGGASGGSFGPPSSVILGPSPFDFIAPNNGFVMVSGGGVKRMQYSTDGAAFFDVGQFYASHPVTLGAALRIDYIGTPIATFFPG
jgi:hypothetical protein